VRTSSNGKVREKNGKGAERGVAHQRVQATDMTRRGNEGVRRGRGNKGGRLATRGGGVRRRVGAEGVPDLRRLWGNRVQFKFTDSGDRKPERAPKQKETAGNPQ